MKIEEIDKVEEQELGVTVYAYCLDSTAPSLQVDNSLLRECLADELVDRDRVYIDDVANAERPNLVRLLTAVAENDVVIVRSVADLGDDTPSILAVLQRLEDKGADVASVLEPWYSHRPAHKYLEQVFAITAELAERKRRLGMERARREGRMGRQPDGRRTEQMMKLRRAGLSVREICEVCGVSRSTFYRRSGAAKDADD